MSDLFQISGSYSNAPASGSPSGDPEIIAPLYESLMLAEREPGKLTLTADEATDLNFGGVTNAHVVIVKTSGKIVLTVTSADGSEQTIPVNSLLVLMCKDAPITALKATRESGTTTYLKYFLGEKA